MKKLTALIVINIFCLGMEHTIRQAKIDFTTLVPPEIVTKIIFHAIKPEENVLIKKNLKELVKFSHVNKSFNQLIHKSNAFSIQNLAKFFKITDRAITYILQI